MKKLLSLALVGLILNASLYAVSVWTPVADKVDASVSFIEIATNDGTLVGSCSGFTIDEKHHNILTAGHCDGEKVTVDGTQAIKIFKDERKDLLVLRAYSVERPALRLAARGPDRGDEIASLGYGWGLEQPMFRIAHVSNTAIDHMGDLTGPFVMIDAGFIGGQSGGPVVNQAGEVVAIVQRGNESLGIGVGAETIKNRVGRYFEK